MPPIHSRLEPRAARYLQLLVEFGHLEDRQVQQVILAACEGWPGLTPVPLSAVQRVAASLLMTEDEPGDTEADLLGADWPLLFH